MHQIASLGWVKELGEKELSDTWRKLNKWRYNNAMTYDEAIGILLWITIHSEQWAKNQMHCCIYIVQYVSLVHMQRA